MVSWFELVVWVIRSPTRYRDNPGSEQDRPLRSITNKSKPGVCICEISMYFIYIYIRLRIQIFIIQLIGT